MGWLLGKVTGFVTGGAMKWVAAGLVVALAVSVGINVLQDGKITARDRIIGADSAIKDELQGVADHNAAGSRALALLLDRAGRAAADLKAENAAQAARLSDIEREVSRVQPTDAQPAACPALPGPVERAVDGLRRLRAGAAGHAGGSPAGAGTGGAADLPRRP